MPSCEQKEKQQKLTFIAGIVNIVEQQADILTEAQTDKREFYDTWKREFDILKSNLYETS